MELKRKKFQGVLNILSFNRHFYVWGLIILAILTLSHELIEWSDLFYWLLVSAFLYALMMPLLVSAYVYDFSGYYDFRWIKNCNIDSSVKNIVNINAGFDETSFIIKNILPNSDLKVFDFYDAKQHTEPAIIRARKVSLVYPNTQQIESNRIPLENKSVDVIFLLSAVHEIRVHEEKTEFLKECHRICKPHGKVIMVEHLRDLPNFLAFSIGFMHFFPRSTWKHAFEKAGFATFNETKFTPFMSIFVTNP